MHGANFDSGKFTFPSFDCEDYFVGASVGDIKIDYCKIVFSKGDRFVFPDFDVPGFSVNVEVHSFGDVSILIVE